MLTKATYVTLFVSDQDKALDFYTRVLGFEKRADNPAPGGGRFVTVGLEGGELQIVLWPGSPGHAKATSGAVPGACILDSSDCKKDYEALRERGAKFEGPVDEQPWALVAVAVDPDGNRIMLRQNRHPAAGGR
jgi:catechol 2,3-dioxygenase-like lactoylglutathione lyase family enzyme